MKTLRLLSGIAVLIMIACYFIFQQSRLTTYRSVLDEIIGEDEEVINITVSADLSFLKKTATVEISDEKLIERILNQEVELKRNIGKEYNLQVDDALFIQTDKETYVIGFDIGSFTLGETKYKTINPGVNPVYELIEDQDFEWEIGPRIPSISTSID